MTARATGQVEGQSMILFLRPDWYPVQREQQVEQINASHELVVRPYDRRTVDLNMPIRFPVKSLNVGDRVDIGIGTA